MPPAAPPDVPTPTRPLRYALVGSGWRAPFFLRPAVWAPERFAVTGVVTRTADRGDAVTARWGVPTARSLADLVRADRPDLVVVSAPRDVAPDVVRAAVRLDLPVVCETPPAPDADGLRRLWADVGASGLVQVAEQYPRMPWHAARLRAVADGVLGTPTSAQVCSTHDYHAVALLRAYLGVGAEPAVVHARRFTTPVTNPLSPAGWSGDAAPVPLATTVATLDWGDRWGGYDFTDNQWWNPVRTERLVVRGTLGELVDDRVVRMADARTPVTSRLEGRWTGTGLNLEGFDLEHVSFDGRMLHRNRFAGLRVADDDVAVLELLADTAAWLHDGGPAPYPLAAAAQDHLLALAFDESVRTGAAVRVEPGPWADALGAGLSR